MKINLDIQGDNTIIPFAHQHLLVGTIHKWLGPNDIHGESGLFSFSWMNGGKTIKGMPGIIFEQFASMSIGAHDVDLLKRFIDGIQKDPKMFNGLIVREITIVSDPDLSEREIFFPASPIFLKEKQSLKGYKHILYSDPQANQVLTDSFRAKLKSAGIDDSEAIAEFAPMEGKAQEKLITYRDVKNKTSWCPVRLIAKPESKLLVWNAGLGNSTGIGFGAIK